MNPDTQNQIDKLRQELRRGVVVLGVLSQLTTAQYGYGLIQRLTELGLDVEEGTLYPLLRRLEKDGLLVSEWDMGESRPRKYYQISPTGREVLDTLRGDWFETVTVMHNMLQETTNDGHN